jgi:DNA-binding GntR family transcriptional regulator
MTSDLKSKAYEYVRDKILAESWPDGKYLSMVQVAKSVNMSYTPVREAIIQLESEGMVEKIPRIGVRPKRVNREEVGLFFEMRLYMESASVELAIERIEDSEIAFLKQNLKDHLETIRRIKVAWKNKVDDQMYFLDGPEAGLLHTLNTAFHETLLKSSRNHFMMDIVDKMHLLTRVLSVRAMLPGTNFLYQLSLDYRYHYLIAKSIVNRDYPSAVKCVRDHVADARDYHLKVYDWLRAVNQLGAFKI